MTLYLINCSKGFISLNGCLKAPRKWSIEDLKGINKEVKKGYSTLLGKRRKKKGREGRCLRILKLDYKVSKLEEIQGEKELAGNLWPLGEGERRGRCG